jgi:hypothetical protein
MKRDKYMGMDVHQATTVVAVIDAEGKSVLERSYRPPLERSDDSSKVSVALFT